MEIPNKIDKRLIFIALFLLIMWGSFLIFLWNKADEITRDPCSICAEVMGETVWCIVNGKERFYHPNGTTQDIIHNVYKTKDINITSVLESNDSIT
jgi:hypothetical protein